MYVSEDGDLASLPHFTNLTNLGPPSYPSDSSFLSLHIPVAGMTRPMPMNGGIISKAV